MPSKALEEYLKKAPAHELETIDKSRQNLDKHGAQLQEHQSPDATYPNLTTGKSDPTPPKDRETTPADSKQLNAVDRALSEGTKKETIEQGQTLDKSGAKLEQQNDLER